LPQPYQSDAADVCVEAFPGLRPLHEHGPGANATVGTHFIVQWWTSGNGGAHELHAALSIKTTDVTIKTVMPRTSTTMLIHEEGPISEYQRIIWDLRSAILGYAEVFQRFTGLTGPNRLLLPTLSGWSERLRKCDDLVATLGWAFPGTLVIGGSPPDGAWAFFEAGDLRPFIKVKQGNQLVTQIHFGIEVGKTGTRKFPITRSPLHVMGVSYTDESPRQQQDRLYAMRDFLLTSSGALAAACTLP